MSWAPRIGGNEVHAIETRHGILKTFGGVPGGVRVTGASMTGPEEMAIQLSDGGVVVWNVETGSYMIYGR